MGRLLLTRLFIAVTCTVSLGALFYVYLFPPPSMKFTREGVPHFTPQIINPLNEETLDLGVLVRHYKGD